jgi:hypothetical protein
MGVPKSHTEAISRGKNGVPKAEGQQGFEGQEEGSRPQRAPGWAIIRVFQCVCCALLFCCVRKLVVHAKAWRTKGSQMARP